MIDVAAEQDLTPGSRDQVFLDSAGSSLPPRPVVDAVVAHVRREAEVGGYLAAEERAEDLVGLPEAVGELLHCSPDSLAFTDSATRAWTQFVTALSWRHGDRILICGNEYASNAITFLQLSHRHGVSIEVVPSDDAGDPDPEALAGLLDERVRLLSLVHVATNSGHVTRLAEAVALAHGVGALVLLDACQSVGQLDLDVQDLGVDALTATGRKWLRGPRGTGFLYVAPTVLAGLEPAAADMRGGTWTEDRSYSLRSDATRFELWEHDVAGRLGLKAAVEHLLGLGAAHVEQAVRARASRLREGLAGVPGVRLHDVGEDLGGIVSFTLDGQPPAETRARLRTAGVITSVSERASTRLDMTARGLSAVVRASPHYFVDDDQVDRAVEVVGNLRRER
ncbi:selenocysteine lyase/cysteine desulfurase [Marmoricola sp. OAE513]|uniref:aminotransferase class V-fold PLP-dependent enzyme n=1 Tax=Marmoricola sp. OAE513 TaxID=2817894 RepID=UPI001AE8E871